MDEFDDVTSLECLPTTSENALNRRIFVGNISVTIPGAHKLHLFFRKFGKVETVKLVYDRNNSLFKKIGFVTFEKLDSVQKALGASDEALTLYGRVLRVHAAEEKRNLQIIQQVQEKQRNECLEPYDLIESGCEDCRYMNNYLNTDCMLHLFSYLTLRERITCERVCKYWRSVSLSSWRTVFSIDIDKFWVRRPFFRIADDNVIQVLKRTNGKVTSIDLTFCRSLTDKLPTIICQCAPLLSNLSLCKTNHVFTLMVAEIIGRNAKHLKVLNLAECDGVTEESLAVLLQHNPYIQELDLSDLQHVNGKCLLQCKDLRRLNLTKCSLITEAVLNQVIESCSDTLEDMVLCFLLGITHVSFNSMCANLRRLDISYIGPNESQELEPVKLTLSGASNLEELVAVCTCSFTTRHENCSELVNNCPNLRKLNMSRNGVLEPLDLSGACRFIFAIAALPSLVELDLSYSDLKFEPELKELTKLQKLESLTLCGCEPLFSETDLAYLIEELARLRHLDVSGVKMLGDAGVTLKVELLRLSPVLSDQQSRPNATLVIGGCGLTAFDEVTEIGRFCIDETDNSNEFLLQSYRRSILYNNDEYSDYESEEDYYPMDDDDFFIDSDEDLLNTFT